MPSYKDLADTADTLPPANSREQSQKILFANQSTTGARIAALGRQVFTAISAILRTQSKADPATESIAMTPATVERAPRIATFEKEKTAFTGCWASSFFPQALANLDKIPDEFITTEFLLDHYPSHTTKPDISCKRQLVMLVIENWLEIAMAKNDFNSAEKAITEMMRRDIRVTVDQVKSVHLRRYETAIQLKQYEVIAITGKSIRQMYPEENITDPSTYLKSCYTKAINDNNPSEAERVLQGMIILNLPDTKARTIEIIMKTFSLYILKGKYFDAYNLIKQKQSTFERKQATILMSYALKLACQKAIKQKNYPEALEAAITRHLLGTEERDNNLETVVTTILASAESSGDAILAIKTRKIIDAYGLKIPQ